MHMIAYKLIDAKRIQKNNSNNNQENFSGKSIIKCINQILGWTDFDPIGTSSVCASFKVNGGLLLRGLYTQLTTQKMLNHKSKALKMIPYD